MNPTGPPIIDDDEKAALARIEQALSTLGAEAAPPLGWEARVLAAQPARRQAPWWRWALVVPAAAGAVLVWRLLRPGEPARMQLAMTVTPHGPVVRSASGASLGDSMTLEVRGARQRILWIYREGRLLISCPGDARCQPSATALRLTWAVQDLGSYAVIAAASATALPAPSGGSIVAA
jgi:hypothetical protein